MTPGLHNELESDPEGLFFCQPELLELLELMVNVMFCAKGIDGRYLAVNAAFVRRTGRSSKREVVGHRASELFSSDLAERYEEQDRKVFTTGEPLRDELELIRREDGSLGWYLTTKLPVCSDAEKAIGLVSISRDLRTGADAAELDAMNDMVDHVQRHLGSTIRVADMAAAAGCSEHQLERRVRKVFGLTPTQYVLRTRVDRATRLLTETNRGLADVAVACGFYDQADFTRRFARLTNETPAQFRARHG